MAGETEVPVVVAPIAEVAPAPAPAPAPPPSAPPEAAAAPPAVSEAPVATAPEAPELPTARPTLLEAFDKENAEAAKVEPPKAEDGEKKPEEVAKPAEAKPEEKPVEVKAEEKPAEAPVVAPVEPEPIKYDFKLPESVTLPEAERGSLDGALTEFARNPNSVEAQQKLVDFHFARVTDSLTAYDRHMHQTFADVRDRWVNEVKADPEIGGGNYKPAMQAVAYVRDEFVSSAPRGSKQYAADMQALDNFLHYTGAGDNPAFLRLMHNVSRWVSEATEGLPPDGKLIPQQETNGRAPIYKSTINRNGR